MTVTVLTSRLLSVHCTQNSPTYRIKGEDASWVTPAPYCPCHHARLSLGLTVLPLGHLESAARYDPDDLVVPESREVVMFVGTGPRPSNVSKDPSHGKSCFLNVMSATINSSSLESKKLATQQFYSQSFHKILQYPTSVNYLTQRLHLPTVGIEIIWVVFKLMVPCI